MDYFAGGGRQYRGIAGGNDINAIMDAEHGVITAGFRVGAESLADGRGVFRYLDNKTLLIDILLGSRDLAVAIIIYESLLAAAEEK